MIETLANILFNPVTIILIIIGTIVGFIVICVRIKMIDSKGSTRQNTVQLPQNRTEESTRQKKPTISDEDLEALEKLWRSKYSRVPGREDDTIEMEAVTATERDHGEAREGFNTRTDATD